MNKPIVQIKYKNVKLATGDKAVCNLYAVKVVSKTKIIQIAIDHFSVLVIPNFEEM